MAPTDTITTQPMNNDPLIGKVFCGRFRLKALINRGGMGKIYKAVQEPLGRTVALKVLDIYDGDAEFRERFFLEASLCARLTHPNTIRIYDYGTTDDGIYFIAMEYLEGESLQRMLSREAPLDPNRALHLTRQIASALAEAHDCGIIHRDLKPGNVFLTRHGDDEEFVKILDFGLVKELGKESELSRTGTVLGSPLYISPEQVHGQEVDGRADVYTTGLMLYLMLTGKTAFKKGNPLHVLMQQTKSQPPSFAEANPELTLPEALEWTVMRCLEKLPENRPASMQELTRALKAVEKQMRGEVASLDLQLIDGLILLPDGLEVSSEVRLPPRRGPDSVPLAAVSQPTMGVTRPLGGGAALLFAGTSMAMISGGVVILLLAVALGAVIVFSGGEQEEPPVVIERPQPPPVEPEVPAAPENAEVTITSEPSGAEVIDEQGVLLGTTPLSLKIPPEDAWVVTVQLKGYEDRKVRVSAEQPEQAVALEADRPVQRRPTPKPDEPKKPSPRKGGDIRSPWGD